MSLWDPVSGSGAEAGCKVLAAAACGVEQFIEKMGGDAGRTLGLSGISEKRLEDPRIPLDLRSYVKMMEIAARSTSNDNFGLLFGQQFKPTQLGLIGEIALSSPTLGSAIENLAAYFRYHQQETETRVVRKGDLLRLEYRIDDRAISNRRQDAELTMGMFLNVFRHCLGTDWAPEEVHFEHLKPLELREHESKFKSPVYFGQRMNALVFNDRQLATRMPQGNLTRLTSCQNEIVRLAGGSTARSLVSAVKAEIRTALPDGYPHIEDVALALAIPRWTLQRRLLSDGYSFSALVELVRRELADAYLRQPHIPIVDIAFALGYSELSAFSRAFSRWFDMPPKSYRQRHIM